MDSERQEPSRREAGDAADSAREALRRLEDRLDRASDAAERLLAQAAAETVARVAGAAIGGRERGSGDSPAEGGPEPGKGRRPPPAGWQVPDSADPGPADHRDDDLETFARVVQSLRELIPPELQRRLAEALRELLLALRALIDWYLERLERRHQGPVEVEDIPIL